MKSSSDKIIDKILQYAEMAEKFASSEVPQYVKEYLEYEAWYHQMWIYWGFVPCLVLIVLALFFSTRKDSSEDEICVSGVSVVFCFFAALITVPHSFVQLKKIEKAPRVYILENLRGK